MANEHLITPCPVCGLIEECPHTPVRCQHRWWSWGKPHSEGARTDVTRWVAGEERECEYCGRIEQAVISWNTVRS
jgi:hypothetical protein